MAMGHNHNLRPTRLVLVRTGTLLTAELLVLPLLSSTQASLSRCHIRMIPEHHPRFLVLHHRLVMRPSHQGTTWAYLTFPMLATC